MSNQSYILQKPSGYYFRFQFPKDVRKLVNKSELRYSLRTGSISLAKSKARMMAGTLQSIIRSIRNGYMAELNRIDVSYFEITNGYFCYLFSLNINV